MKGASNDELLDWLETHTETIQEVEEARAIGPIPVDDPPSRWNF